jgi:hypothetical protein
MYFPPAPFNLDDAVTCSLLVDTAYDQFTQWVNAGHPDQADFEWRPKAGGFAYSAPLWWVVKVEGVQVYDEPFGFVAQAPGGDAFLVFRGTETDADGAQDLRTDQTPYPLLPSFGNVHAGFASIYSALSPAVVLAVNALPGVTRFFFTGHSLGAGLATLAVPDVIAHTRLKPSPALPMVQYTLASPRVGDPQFADLLTTQTNVPTFRIVNTEDVVPDVPPPVIGALLFKHVGTPVDFTAQYGSIDANHAQWTAYHYALTNPDQPEGPMPALINRVIGPTSFRIPSALLVGPR